MPHILVTGGAGYIGSHSAFLLTQYGYKVIILDSFVHNQSFSHPWATVVRGDIGDVHLLQQIFEQYPIAAVMHFAAFIEVGESVKDPQKYYDNNVSKTLTLLQIMRQYNVNTFIFSSSCAVYGIPQYLPLTEKHPKNPISPYGKTKLIIEMALEDFSSAYGLKYVALRYFNAAGALPEEGLGESHIPETHVIPILLDCARTGKPFTIFGNDYPTPDGTAIRDYIHVRDIAVAHVQALKKLEQHMPSDSFNLGTGKGFSVQEIVSTIEAICYTKLNIVIKDRRIGDPPILVANPAKSHTILGWKPKYSDIYIILKSAYTYNMSTTLKYISRQNI